MVLPLVLSAGGVLTFFAVFHSDKLFWINRLQALYPEQDPARLLHLYGVGLSARSATLLTVLAPIIVLLVRATALRNNPHRDLLLLCLLFTVFQFQCHAWEAPIFLAVLLVYVTAFYLLERHTLHPAVYVLLAAIWLFWLFQYIGLVPTSTESHIFARVFWFVSTSESAPRVVDLVGLIVDAHAPVILHLFCIGVILMLVSRGQRELLVIGMLTFGLFVYFVPEREGLRAYKVIIPFAAYVLAWVVFKTYECLGRWPLGRIRPVALLAFATALGVVASELVRPFHLYYSQSYPGQRYAQYLADYEHLTLAWLRENLSANARLVSDPHDMHVFSELTNSVDLLEHAMTVTEMSPSGRRQVSDIKNRVFAAENSQQAYQALYDLLGQGLSYRNRDYATRTGKEARDVQFLVIVSGKTSQWLESVDLDPSYHPVVGDVDPTHLSNFYDLRFFRLLYQVDDTSFVFAAAKPSQLEQNTARYLIAQGNDRWFAGQEKKAIALYQSAIQLDPQDAEAYIALGEVYRQRGELESAVQMLEQAVRYQPGDADLYRVLGDMCLVRNETHGAARWYGKAIQLRPDHPALYASLADAYLMQGDVESARLTYARSARSPFGEAETLVALGDLYMDKDLPELAETTYLQALALDPDLALAHYGLANLYQPQGRMQEAVVAYQRLIEAQPYQLEWYRHLAQLSIDRGRPEAAVSAYEKAAKAYPRSKDFYLQLGELYLNLAGL